MLILLGGNVGNVCKEHIVFLSTLTLFFGIKSCAFYVYSKWVIGITHRDIVMIPEPHLD